MLYVSYSPLYVIAIAPRSVVAAHKAYICWTECMLSHMSALVQSIVIA